MSTRMLPMFQPAVQERRRYPRRSWNAEVQSIYVTTAGRRVVEVIRVVDISRGGLGAITRNDHDVGEHFVVGLPDPSGRTRYVHGKVVRSWNDQNGPHIGMQFSKVPADLGLWLNACLAA